MEGGRRKTQRAQLHLKWVTKASELSLALILAIIYDFLELSKICFMNTNGYVFMV